MAYHSGTAGALRVVLRRSCLSFISLRHLLSDNSEFGKCCCKCGSIIVG